MKFQTLGSYLFILTLNMSSPCEIFGSTNAQLDSLKTLQISLEAKLDSIRAKILQLEVEIVAIDDKAEENDPPEDAELIPISSFELESPMPPPPPPPEYGETNPQLYIAYDDPPTPIGGYSAFYAKLVYPEAARKAKIEGRVTVNVLIDESGNVVETKILKSLGEEFDNAALEAIKSTKWNPAKQRTRPVKVWVGLTVVFQIKKANKLIGLGWD